MDKVKNPKKMLAIELCHLQEQLKSEYLNDWDKDGIKQALKEIYKEIARKNYSIASLFHYIEEYKTIKMSEYIDWMHS